MRVVREVDPRVFEAFAGGRRELGSEVEGSRRHGVGE